MPEVTIAIGGRTFEVACQEGEQPYLEAAARMLDQEASSLSDQMGRVPEARMLLMAGLMLADKTAGLEDQVRASESQLADLQSALDEVREAPPATVEVPVVPPELEQGLTELATQAEALADEIEALAAGPS